MGLEYLEMISEKSENGTRQFVKFQIAVLVTHRPIPFEGWLIILVSHFYLLCEERKGREGILVQTESVYNAKFY